MDYPIEQDGWLRACRYVLVFVGVCYLLLIGVTPFFAGHAFNDPEMGAAFNRGFTIGFVAVMFLVCASIAAVNFATAIGLRRGRRWAWIAGVCLGGLYVASICLPFGALILYALLRERPRRAYLDRAPAPLA